MDITQGIEPLCSRSWIVYDNALTKKVIEIRIPPDGDDPSNFPVAIFMAYDATHYEISKEDLSAAIRLLSFKVDATKRSGNKRKQLRRKILRELARNHVTIGSRKPLQKNNSIFFKEEIEDFYYKHDNLRHVGLHLKKNDERLHQPEKVVKPTCVGFEKHISIIFPLKDDQTGFNVITYEDIVEALKHFYNSSSGKWSIVIKKSAAYQSPIDHHFCMCRPNDGKVHMFVSYVNCTFPRHVTPRDFDLVAVESNATVSRSFGEDDHPRLTVEMLENLPVKEIIPLSRYLASTKTCRKLLFIKLLFIWREKFSSSLMTDENVKIANLEYCARILSEAKAIFRRNGLLERCVESLLNKSDLTVKNFRTHFSMPGLFGHLRFVFQIPESKEEGRIALCLGDNMEHLPLAPKSSESMLHIPKRSNIWPDDQTNIQRNYKDLEDHDDLLSTEKFYLERVFIFTQNFVCPVWNNVEACSHT